MTSSPSRYPFLLHANFQHPFHLENLRNASLFPQVFLATTNDEKAGEEAYKTKLASCGGGQHVVKLLDLLRDDKRCYIVEEFVAGGDMCDKILSTYPQGIPADIARVWFRSIVAALASLKHKGLCHMDISPEVRRTTPWLHISASHLSLYPCIPSNFDATASTERRARFGGNMQSHWLWQERDYSVLHYPWSSLWGHSRRREAGRYMYGFPSSPALPLIYEARDVMSFPFNIRQAYVAPEVFRRQAFNPFSADVWVSTLDILKIKCFRAGFTRFQEFSRKLPYWHAFFFFSFLSSAFQQKTEPRHRALCHGDR